jgi:hypothetical protein
MRALLIIAAFALAACEEPVVGGPTESDVHAGLADYFQNVVGAGPLSQWNPQNFKDSRIVSLGRCEALGSDYLCPVTFERPRGAGQAKRFVWMSKEPGGWTVTVISLTEDQ